MLCAAITVTGPEGTYTLPCRQLILCPGHSARDTFELLYRRGVPMEAKPFAVGVRIEQRQSDCDAAQYKQYAGHPGLPASTYKLSCHLPNGRGVFSFCVCPGGQVVAAASEEHRVVTNGMSEFARDKENINGAPAGERHPGGFRRRTAPWRVSPSSGGLEEPPLTWAGQGGLPCPRPAGGGLPCQASLHRAGPGHSQLPPRRHMDEPLGLPAGLRGGVHRARPCPFWAGS